MRGNGNGYNRKRLQGRRFSLHPWIQFWVLSSASGLIVPGPRPHFPMYSPFLVRCQFDRSRLLVPISGACHAPTFNLFHVFVTCLLGHDDLKPKLGGGIGNDIEG